MYCRNCGKELKTGAKFCSGCGAAVPTPEKQQYAAPVKQPDGPIKKKPFPRSLIALAVVAVVALAVLCGWLISSTSPNKSSTDAVLSDQVPSPEPTVEQPSQEQPIDIAEPVETIARPQLLNFAAEEPLKDISPSVTPYSVEPGLSNVINLSKFYLSDEEIQKLEQNQFVISESYRNEFFQQYETNRYLLIPNFITVDSMMHTYHLYFSLLLNRTEKNYLASDLLALSTTMLANSTAQYEALKGTQWETAAHRNTAYFAIAAQLQEPSLDVPAFAKDLVSQEISNIYDAAGIGVSPLVNDYMDYSQYKPRGYYEGDETLEQYFRAMMWYGQVNFTQTEEDLNRSALLMTLAMDSDCLKAWEKIYTITTFFAGASDDLGYYEYAPAIEAAYGEMPDAAALIENEQAFQKFLAIADSMAPPAINSVPMLAETEGDPGELKKGFRFMGQRFSIDAAVMQRLVFRYVGKNEKDEVRMLPDFLDVPAAMGSDIALQLLEQQGVLNYAGYTENMDALRDTLQQAPESSWTTSLYSSWLYTLKPILETKGEGYPSFMCSEEWSKKNLETFAGSFTELKHDTVLYAKQMMAEMGGGPPEVIDDRGYVEPETEVFRRFMLLAQQTERGLNQFGLISSEDSENLNRLAELARRLMVISQKELQNELLTDDEYELIRCYGGTLEHFWEEAVKDKAESSYLDPAEIPASLITDVATDPNGRILQIATGRPAEMLVLVSVDGKLRIASGVVYNYYQFENQIENRMTDTEWRQKTGEWMMPDGKYNRNVNIEKPWWTKSYWIK